MGASIWYCTGTGNSLWAARALAERLGGEARAMAAHREGPVRDEAPVVGLVFPVHMWGVPAPVLDHVARLQVADGAWVFAVAVHAGQVSRTLVQLGEVLAARGLTLRAGTSLTMPTNYVPWGGPGPEEEQRALREAAQVKLAAFADQVRERREGPVERGPLWQRVVFTGIYKVSFSKIATMDENFWVDERCTGCGTCVKVCPSGDIRLEDGKPRWSGRCEQCLACIQWCPETALQYGKKTPAYPRYHHPEVKVADLIHRR